ncbi:Receptor-type guanylate cyclase gcy [Seminavis robusta]|uniref:Receptor-type guanylate cyclase gcy n=1 Tax=Seminavis robusta TaxID=568900 RepID=A0A9N8EEV4_9STRA|nr:Receptor-type guanylate cyclase gcy [Seminavis robusta]|eukprot:Sro975_g226740.1 Receptor-type guanylate cyclase gcy (1303) ;mRNA; f:3226-8555
MTGTLDMEDSLSVSQEGSSSFADEHSMDADTIDYDGLGNDSSHGTNNHNATSSRRTHFDVEDNDKKVKKDKKGDKPMLANGKKISSTFRWKLFVIFLMFVNTSIVVIATSVYLDNDAGREFERAFNNAAMTVADGVHHEMQGVTDSLQVLGETITSYCQDTNTQWPYVTLPNFEQRVTSIRKSSVLNIMGFLPLIDTEERTSWEGYSAENQIWIQDSYNALLAARLAELAAQEASFSEEPTTTDINDNTLDDNTSNNVTNRSAGTEYSISPEIVVSTTGQYNLDPTEGPFAPLWQLSPPPPPSKAAVINTDLMSSDSFYLLFQAFLRGQAPSEFAISHVVPMSLYSASSTNDAVDAAEHDVTNPQSSNETTDFAASPQSFLFHPIHTSYIQHHEDPIQAFAMGILPWEDFFSDLLPDDISGIVCVLRNPCDAQAHSFLLQGRNATFLGRGDLHDTQYEASKHQPILTETVSYGVVYTEEDQRHSSRQVSPCHYTIDIYPSAEFSSEIHSKHAVMFTLSIAGVFIGTGLIFLAYVYLIGNRQNKVMAIAMSTSAIVSSLFPSTVRDRILQEAQAEVKVRMSDKSKGRAAALRSSRRNSLKQIQEKRKEKRSKPNADLFPETTVLFADIVGFTAWSSVREPTQVFELLETIYHSFDEIARRRKVFKVETIGDCYVAATGLPEPCKEHAVNMCRFARDCLYVMEILTKKLEVKLGPDTGELSMRFGLHSGAVTAGVLRGERSRFQLFGDTVNTAARMESNGKREKIHISEQTAEQLIKSGKEDWFEAREDKIIAKGKGELQTYWLHNKKVAAPMSEISDGEDSSVDIDYDWLDLPTELFDSNRSKMCLGTNEIRQCLSEQNQRLADWNCNQLAMLLSNLVAHRKIVLEHNFANGTSNQEYEESYMRNAHVGVGDSGSILKEAGNTVDMPLYDAKAFVEIDDMPVNLNERVQQQLQDYVSIICSMYIDHPFHSYQHASHCTMNIIKLLSNLAASPNHTSFAHDESSGRPCATRDEEQGRFLYEKTFGISADPMTHFALAFAILIHDADHPGVPNSTLVRENGRLSRIFEKRSIAEQNSFQCAWDLLMDPGFEELREAIYASNEEYHRFRQIVVNAVVATDLFDEELNVARQQRWDEAFPKLNQKIPLPESSLGDIRDMADRKATVVLELMVQASDVAHTMQHWHVYQKWNQRLFHEQLKAHKAGRLEEDPCDYWYQGELDFFDTTVIPLAKKLRSSGAFEVCFDEYLACARQNRTEWQRRGQEIVSEMEKTFEAIAMGALSSRMDLLDDETTLHDDDTTDDPYKRV